MHPGPITDAPAPAHDVTPTDLYPEPVDGLVEHSPARPFAAEVTYRDGSQERATVCASDVESARNLLRAPDTVVRILSPDAPHAGHARRDAGAVGLSR